MKVVTFPPPEPEPTRIDVRWIDFKDGWQGWSPLTVFQVLLAAMFEGGEDIQIDNVTVEEA